MEVPRPSRIVDAATAIVADDSLTGLDETHAGLMKFQLRAMTR